MKSNLAIGQWVFVDFEACSQTAADGTHVYGHGVIERLDDGYCMGTLDTGMKFCCPLQYVHQAQEDYKAPSDIDLFIKYIEADPNYPSLINIHGNKLFNCDSDHGFRVLAIRLAYRLWLQQRAKQSITKRDLNRFNIVLCLFFAGLVVNFGHSFGIGNAGQFAADSLVLTLALWLFFNLIKTVMSKNINE